MDRAPPTLQCVELLLSVRLSVRLCPSVRPPRPSVCLRFLPLPRISVKCLCVVIFYTRVCCDLCIRAERFSAEIPQQCAGLGQVHIDSTFVYDTPTHLRRARARAVRPRARDTNFSGRSRASGTCTSGNQDSEQIPLRIF